MAKWLELDNLAQPLPRCLRIKAMPTFFAALLPIALLVTGAAIIFMVFQVCAKIAALQTTGASAEGIITNLQAQTSRGGTTYLTRYEFRPRNTPDIGRSVQHAESPVTASDFSTLRVGSPVTVRFQPSRPETSELQMTLQTIWADPWERFQSVSHIVIGVSGSTSLFCLLLVGRMWLKERRLLTWGTAAPARVIAEKEVQGRNGTTLTVTYEFEDRPGHIIRGKRAGLPTRDKLTSPRNAALDSAVRRNPTVLYDPNRPSRNMLYPPEFMTL